MLKIIVIVTLCVILTLLFLRFMFNEGFRKDLIAGDSETKILGVLSVQGALMAVLALGLVGGMITVLKWGDAPQGTSTNAAISFNPRSWYAIDLSGKPIDASVTVGTETTPVGLSVGSIKDSTLFDEANFKLTEKDNDLWITKNNLLWGKVNGTGNSGLFSDFFVTDENELPINYYHDFTFEKKNGKWPEAQNFFNHFQIVISEKIASKPKYVITNLKTGSVVYDSKGNQKDFGFYQDEILSRKFHVFKSENNFFLFRITSVSSLHPKHDVPPGIPTVKFMGVRLKVE